MNSTTTSTDEPIHTLADLTPILESIAKVWASFPERQAEIKSKYRDQVKMAVIKKLAATVAKLNKIGASFEPGTLSDLTELFKGTSSKKEIADRLMEFEAGFTVEEILSCKPTPKARTKKVAAPKPIDTYCIFQLGFALAATGLKKFSAILGVGSALAEFDSAETVETVETVEKTRVGRYDAVSGYARREYRRLEEFKAQFLGNDDEDEDDYFPISEADLRELLMH